MAKTLNPALAGTEAMQRYREGRKGDAAISAVQALGGPIGFGAGVVNYIKSRGSAATQTEPQSAPATSGGKSKESLPKTEKGGGGDKKPPNTKVGKKPADGGEPSPTAGTIDTALGYQISRDALSNVKDILSKIKPPKVTKRTKTGRRSAGS